MDVLSKVEYYGLLALKERYGNISEDKINQDLISQYSTIDLRRKNNLINTIYANVLNNTYRTSEDLNNAKVILTHLLISITDKELNECLVVSENDNFIFPNDNTQEDHNM